MTPTDARIAVPIPIEAHNRPMHCVVVVTAVVVVNKLDVVLPVVASDVLEIVTVPEFEPEPNDTETQRTSAQSEVVVPSVVDVDVVVSAPFVVLEPKPAFTLMAPSQPARSDGALLPPRC